MRNKIWKFLLFPAIVALPVVGVAQTTQPTKPRAAEAAKPMLPPPLDPAPTPPKADAQMQAVLDELAALGGKPIETLTPAQARKQPTPADAVKRLLKKQGKPVMPEPVAKAVDRKLKGPAGMVPIRIYTPDGSAPMRVIVYIHGGGWVIANLDVYDASPRALANAANAIVVSVEYRHASEHRFPAAHDDTFAAYR